mgnify:CR=1 FL=1
MRKFFIGSLLLGAISTTFIAKANGQNITAADLSSADIDSYTELGLDGRDQISSIDQFGDIRPTDWAYQAIKNLAETYGCVAGYPDQSLRGDQSISRYEAAALLNSCLDSITERTDEIKKLIYIFESELAIIKGRIDGLEARIGELDAMKFSPFSKLKGEASFMMGAVNYGGDVNDNIAGELYSPRQDAFHMIHSLRLGFKASFTGKDYFLAQIRTGNASSSAFNTFNPATPFYKSTVPLAALDRAFTPSSGDNGFDLERMYYKFPLGQNVTVTVAPKIMNMGLWASYPTAYGVRGDYILDYFSSFGTPGVYNKAVGAGGAVTWRSKGGNPFMTSHWLATVNYLAISGNVAGESGGFMTDESRGSIAAQFGYQSPLYGLVLGYRYGQNGTDFLQGTKTITRHQSWLEYGTSSDSHSFAVNGWLRPMETGWIPSLSVGWGINTLNNNDVSDPTYSEYDRGVRKVSESQSWMVGLQWDDISGIMDSLSFAIGQPTFATALADGSTPNDGNYIMELWYRYPYSNNISIMPGLFYLSRPNGQLTQGNFDTFGGVVQVNLTF